MEDIVKTLTMEFQKFTSAIRRHCCLIWRNKEECFWQLFYPALVILMLVLVRTIRYTLPYEKIMIYEPEELKFPKPLDLEKAKWKIAYSPQPEFITDYMKRVVAFSKNYPTIDEPDPEFELDLDTEVLRTAEDLEIYLTSDDPADDKMRNDILAGVEFPDEYEELSKLPKEVVFALRFPGELRTCPLRKTVSSNWHTDKLGDIVQFDTFDDFNETVCAKAPNYVEEGFILLQHMICCSRLEESEIKLPKEPKIGSPFKEIRNHSHTLMGNITTNQFTNPNVPNDPLLNLLQDNISIIILLAIIYPCLSFAQLIVNEKEQRLKEYLRIMGLSIWMYWATWLIAILSVLVFSLTLVVFMLKASYVSYLQRAIFTEANPIILFVFLMMYATASICFSFMIASFCEKVSTVCCILPLMWFLSYIPYYYLYHAYSSLSFVGKCLLCLFPNTAMAYGFNIFIMHEFMAIGTNWDNVSFLYYDHFNLGVVMLMLMLDAFIFLLITFYIDEVYPHTFGRFRLFFYCCTCSFWGCCTGATHGLFKRDTVYPCPCQPSHIYSGRNVTISMQNLTKEYFNGKCIVLKDINFDILEHDVTVILGCSGTGKSLLLNIITGMIRSTSGKVIINGYTIKRNTSTARRGMGYAAQEIMLYDKLTVMEHLNFYACIKSHYFSKEAAEDNHRLIKLFGMYNMMSYYPCQFDSIRRKKLSVAIALCGNSNLVILDEPTLGLPYIEEKKIWEIIEMERSVCARTVIVTSSNMRDVNHGDRIALLDEGQLVLVNPDCAVIPAECDNSAPHSEGEDSEEVSSTCDNSYYLTLGKGGCCQVKKTTKLLKQFIPTSAIDHEEDAEFSYILDLTYKDNFLAMFCELEAASKELGIISFCLSTSQPPALNLECPDLDICYCSEKCSQTEGGIAKLYPHLGQPFPCCTQIYALFKKKLLFICRNCTIYIFLFLLSILIILLTVFVIKTAVYKILFLTSSPPMLITRESYEVFMSVSNSPYPDRSIVTEGILAPIVFFFDQMRKLYYSVPDSITQNNITSKEINEFILEEYKYCGKGNPYQCGNTINETRCIAWHNRYIYHSLPLAMNLLHICDVRNLAYTTGYTFQVINKPLKFKKDTVDFFRDEKYLHQRFMNEVRYPMVIAMGYCMSVVTAYLVMFYIKERVSGFKFQQLLSNVSYGLFWLTAFIIDVIFLIFLSFMFFLMVQVVVKNSILWLILLPLILFCFNILPLVYLCSFCFQTPRNGFIGMLMLNLYFGLLLFMFIEMIHASGSFAGRLAFLLDHIFLIFPIYNLCSALKKIIYFEYGTERCAILCQEYLTPVCDPCAEDPICCHLSLTSWRSGIIANCVLFLVCGLLCFLILYIFEYTQFGCLKGLRELLQFRTYCDDVPSMTLLRATIKTHKKRTINNMKDADMERHALVIKNMSKVYRKNKKYHSVLDSIFLSVKAGECIGIIGKHKVGKTTFCQLLIGEKAFSTGDAYMFGYSVTNNIKVIHQLIGYCPERDTYMENMTVKETLSILSLIRGISPGRVDYHINKVAKTLKFEECLELKLCKLGDVSRRTVTIGVAFLGEPDILILDEPTKGLNREAKKILFTNIKEIIRTKRTVVITETDAREICSVTSRIVCLETTKVPSRLKEPKKLCKKSKTSETAPGLTISITLKDRGKEEDELDKLFSNCVDKTASRHCSKADMFVQCSRILEPAARAVREFILEMFPCAVVRHCGGLSMDFRVPASNEISQGVPNDVLYVTTPTGTNPIQLWEVYTALENEKCALNIENYKITVYKRAQVRMFLSYDPNIKGLKVCKTCM